MVSKRVKKIIHDTVLDIWMNEIQKDYNAFRLLKEDSLKNAFYHHLRSRLGDTFLDEHGLFIWTEFNDGPLKGTGKRADIAIVTIDRTAAMTNQYLGNCVDEIIAIFELKFKASYTAVQEIQSDAVKIRRYIQDDKIDCMYYLVAIRELMSDDTKYIGNRGVWMNGRVTELLGSFTPDEKMEFTVVEH